MSAKHVSEITEDDRAEFLDFLRDGLDQGAAARLIGTTGTQMRKFRRSHSVWFDPEFADACAAAEASSETAITRKERIDEMVWLAAEKGDWRAIEKLAYAYHPDFEHLRHSNLRVSGEIMVSARQIFPHLTDEQLERIAQQKEDDEGTVPLALLPPAVDG